MAIEIAPRGFMCLAGYTRPVKFELSNIFHRKNLSWSSVATSSHICLYSLSVKQKKGKKSSDPIPPCPSNIPRYVELTR